MSKKAIDDEYRKQRIAALSEVLWANAFERRAELVEGGICRLRVSGLCLYPNIDAPGKAAGLCVEDNGIPADD